MHVKVHHSRILVQVKSKKEKNLLSFEFLRVYWTKLNESMDDWCDVEVDYVLRQRFNLGQIKYQVKSVYELNQLKWKLWFGQRKARYYWYYSTLTWSLSFHLVLFRDKYTPIWPFLTFGMHSPLCTPIIGLLCGQFSKFHLASRDGHHIWHRHWFIWHHTYLTLIYAIWSNHTAL